MSETLAPPLSDQHPFEPVPEAFIPAADQLLQVPELQARIDDVADLGGVATTALTPAPLAEQKQKDSTEILDEAIDARVEKAIKSCEFEPTKEIQEAIHGFYTDHMTLKAAIEAVVNGEYNSPILERILEADGYEEWEKTLGSKPSFYESNGEFRPEVAPNAKVYSLRIAAFAKEIVANGNTTPQDRLKAMKICGRAVGALFTESSVGISTITEEEIEGTAQLADTIRDQAGTDLLYKFSIGSQGNFFTGEDLAPMIRDAQEQFWADTRHAGQLLFHGSMNIGGINQRGIISRNEQLRQTGEMNNYTALNWGGDTMHSVVPHFSEFYGLGQYTAGDRGGTVAVPLIKVIQKAPYARDAKFGIVKLKDPSETRVPKITIDLPVAQSGAGQPDRPGAVGVDRVFFASPDEKSPVPPDAYVVDLFDKTNKPASYIVDQTNHNPFANELALSGAGMGFGFPERVIIERTKDETMNFEERTVLASAEIVQLQQEYYDAYNRYGVVVPLRRGVFAQVLEGVSVDDTKGRPQATVYNKYTPGTGKQY